LGKSAKISSLNWDTYETLLHMLQAYFDTQYNVVTAFDISWYEIICVNGYYVRYWLYHLSKIPSTMFKETASA